MPNWVDNTTKILGGRKAVKDCLARISGVEEYVGGKTGENLFDFDKIKPMPEKVRDTNPSEALEKGNRDNWYDWSVDNWGTKWNSSNSDIVNRFDDGDIYVVEINYQTAWSMPLPIWDELAKQYPKLEFRHKFDEEMQHFYGVAVYKNGKLNEERSWTKEFDDRWTNY
tara:strand:- start:939 stop:1442 length:504 start_codon:yes stop_codon:yes gene_type:complete